MVPEPRNLNFDEFLRYEVLKKYGTNIWQFSKIYPRFSGSFILNSSSILISVYGIATIYFNGRVCMFTLKLNSGYVTVDNLLCNSKVNSDGININNL